LPFLFPHALISVTPQGFFRAWDAAGRVSFGGWQPARSLIEAAGATVISLFDVGADQSVIQEIAASSKILVVTAAERGATLYQQGEPCHFPARQVSEVSALGAGDIFAAALFVHLHQTGDPRAAARFATQLASFSVQRVGMASIPTPEEINSCYAPSG